MLNAEQWSFDICILRWIYRYIKSCYMHMQIWASIKRYNLFEFDYKPCIGDRRDHEPTVDGFTRTNKYIAPLWL